MTITRTFYAMRGARESQFSWYQKLGHDFSQAIDTCIRLNCPLHVKVTEHQYHEVVKEEKK